MLAVPETTVQVFQRFCGSGDSLTTGLCGVGKLHPVVVELSALSLTWKK